MNYKFLLTLIFFSVTAAFPVCAQPRIVEMKPWNEADYPSEYYSKEIRARIVDADTGQPLEGVVVAKWVLSGGIKPPIDLEVLEAVTDKDGWFYIPGWGPKKRPVLRYLENRDPELLIFKSGYKYNNFWNARKEFYKDWKVKPQEMDSDELNNTISGVSPERIFPTDSVRESIWDGTTIKLHKFVLGEEIKYNDSYGRPAIRKLTEEDYWMSVSDFQHNIGWAGDYTNWKAIKHAVREIEKNRKALPKKFEWYLSPLPDNVRKIIYEGDKP
jgi:hypothetical protein